MKTALWLLVLMGLATAGCGDPVEKVSRSVSTFRLQRQVDELERCRDRLVRDLASVGDLREHAAASAEVLNIAIADLGSAIRTNPAGPVVFLGKTLTHDEARTQLIEFRRGQLVCQRNLDKLNDAKSLVNEELDRVKEQLAVAKQELALVPINGSLNSSRDLVTSNAELIALVNDGIQSRANADEGVESWDSLLANERNLSDDNALSQWADEFLSQGTSPETAVSPNVEPNAVGIVSQLKTVLAK